jgi:hypothetical protein
MSSNLDFVLGANAVNLNKIIQGMAISLWHTSYEIEPSVPRQRIIATVKTMAIRPDLLAKIQAIIGRELSRMFFAFFVRFSLLRAASQEVDADARAAFQTALSS